jgi:hypothetical protein
LRLKFVRNVKKTLIVSQPTAVATIKQDVILYCLTLTQKKNIREPIHTITPKGSTVNLKDFKTDLGTVDGLLRFDENFKLKLELKK